METWGGALVLRRSALVLVEGGGKGGAECRRGLAVWKDEAPDLVADGVGGSLSRRERFLLGNFE